MDADPGRARGRHVLPDGPALARPWRRPARRCPHRHQQPLRPGRPGRHLRPHRSRGRHAPAGAARGLGVGRRLRRRPGPDVGADLDGRVGTRRSCDVTAAAAGFVRRAVHRPLRARPRRAALVPRRPRPLPGAVGGGGRRARRCRSRRRRRGGADRGAPGGRPRRGDVAGERSLGGTSLRRSPLRRYPPDGTARRDRCIGRSGSRSRRRSPPPHLPVRGLGAVPLPHHPAPGRPHPAGRAAHGRGARRGPVVGDAVGGPDARAGHRSGRAGIVARSAGLGRRGHRFLAAAPPAWDPYRPSEA